MKNKSILFLVIALCAGIYLFGQFNAKATAAPQPAPQQQGQKVEYVSIIYLRGALAKGRLYISSTNGTFIAEKASCEWGDMSFGLKKVKEYTDLGWEIVSLENRAAGNTEDIGLYAVLKKQ